MGYCDSNGPKHARPAAHGLTPSRRRFSFLTATLIASIVATTAASAHADEAADIKAGMQKCLGMTGGTEVVLNCYRKLTDDFASPKATAAESAAAFAKKEAASTTPSPSREPATELAASAATPPSPGGWTPTHVRQVMIDNMELSYFTFGTGVHFGGDKTNTHMLYEGQIFHNIPIWPPSSSAGDANFWLDLPIRIGLRQLTIDSYPVRTPSFNPGLRAYWSPRETGLLRPEGKLTYYSLGVHHYSNGQEKLFNDPDKGTINTVDGSFNTNYVEAAAHLVTGKFQTAKEDNSHVPQEPWMRFAFRQHFYGTWEHGMRDEYPKRSLSAEVRSRDDVFGHLQFRLGATYGWGYSYVVKNDAPPCPPCANPVVQDVRARFSDKLNTTAEAIFQLPKLGDLSFYLRYDHGYDYYNINFQNSINRLQIGFAAKDW